MQIESEVSSAERLLTRKDFNQTCLTLRTHHRAKRCGDRFWDAAAKDSRVLLAETRQGLACFALWRGTTLSHAALMLVMGNLAKLACTLRLLIEEFKR